MKPLYSIITSITLGLSLIACQPKEKKTASATETPVEKTVEKETEVQKIESAHHKADFLAKKAVQYDFVLYFGGKKGLDVTITTLTNSSKAKIEFKDGNTIIVSKDKVFHTPEYKDKKTRFTAYTWNYFFLFPYKLSDNGTHWSEFGNELLNDTPYNIQKLTFGNDVGDSPDDWYYVYSNPENHLLSVASYIVTFSKSVEKAEQDPHAIKYDNFVEVDGIPMATNWSFWGWTREKGLTKQIGEATVKNIHFLDEVDFTVPENFIEK